MNSADNILELIQKLGKRLTREKRILSLLYSSYQPVDRFNAVEKVLLKLHQRGFIEIDNDQVSLTDLGRAACEFWQEPNDGELEEPSRSTQAKKAKLEKSNQFLELYKQGLSYQDIGDQHGISRERVRQVLKPNPAFHEYLKEQEIAEALAEKEKEEREKQEFYLKSLAVRYPERVAELWDYEKNGTLKPEDVPAGSISHFIWLKCPLDGNSWQKKPNAITTSWNRGASGCPMCAGKKKKPEKQPSLIEVYPELISQYWDYEKNNNLNLDPAKITLSSNKKAGVTFS